MMMMMMMIIIMIMRTMMIMIIIIIIIIIAFKGAVRDFFLQSPHCAANRVQHAQVARAKSCANHVQHIERLSRATCVTWYERTAHLIKFDRV